MAAPVYLDYQATTPLDPRVFEVMRPYYEGKFGNPHSATHRYGWEAAAGIDFAREQLAESLHVSPAELVFTSGATESNNLAIKGVMEARGSGHIITVVSEHKCVLETVKSLEGRGFDVSYLSIDKDGLIDLDELKRTIRPDTGLISIMAVNNEIGVIQPLKDIANIAHEHDILFHCDAAQALGKMPLDLKDFGVDLASFSGHKIYGPKAVGALYVRSGAPLIRLKPVIDGGGQEGGIRSGTLSPALCAGFGAAVAIANQEMDQEQERAKRHFHMMLDGLQQHIPDLQINGSLKHRLYSNLNLSFPGLDGSRLLRDLRGLAVSSGAACASAVSGPSYVLEALGLSKDIAQSTLRIGTGRFTTDIEIQNAVAEIVAAYRKQKE